MEVLQGNVGPKATPRQVRAAWGLTREKFGQAIGVGINTIQKWEARPPELRLPHASAAQRIERLMELRRHMAPMATEREMAGFLLSPNPALGNYPPADLLGSGWAFERLLEIVARVRTGPTAAAPRGAEILEP